MSIFYILAKFGVDTAENGPLKVCEKLAKVGEKNIRKNIGITDAHHMERERPDVVDKDLLLAATRKIEAAAREHPGWSAVAERMDS